MIYAWNHMSMPSRASTSLLQDPDEDGFDEDEFVSMPSRASTSLLRRDLVHPSSKVLLVSMPSRASTSLLLRKRDLFQKWGFGCQCPHGLVPHCYA